MKKLIYSLNVIAILVMFSVACRGQQEGYIYTIGGCHNCSPSLIDGSPAKDYSMGGPAGVWVDNQSNVYIAELHNHVVRKIIPATGLIYTVAGNGATGFAGDGGAATSAELNSPIGICLDAPGNLYIADTANHRVRKVDKITGIISTIAGGGNDTSDGILAIYASITPQSVYVNAAGDIYIGTNNKVRKVDAVSGVITTIAGDGANVTAGDGGQAISASFAGDPTCITEDLAGNMYVISESGGTVRKINAITGVITKVAGGGGSTLDGVPATTANLFDIKGCGLDAAGNIYLADGFHAKVRKVDALTGLINTVAGNGNAQPDSVPALTAATKGYLMYVDNAGSIYYSGGTGGDSFLYKIVGAAYYSADSFSVSVMGGCNNTTLTVWTNSYAASLHIKAFFGDNQLSIDSAVLPANNGGYAIINHAFTATGTYSLKLVLYNGNTKIDSFQFSHQNKFCNTTFMQLYFDGNGNCVDDVAEPAILCPTLIQVDSNNVHIDTISATSGFYYTAYGNSGDAYAYKVISPPSGMQVACPASGIINITLQASNITPTQFMGFSCIAGNNFDLSADDVIAGTGVHLQMGDIFVKNNFCSLQNAVVTLDYSPKYEYVSASPVPTSHSGNSITWNVNGLNFINNPFLITYTLTNGPAGLLSIGDTAQTQLRITPTTGDVDLSNNVIIINDTVKGSFDPNLIEVAPAGRILSGWQLKYRIEFENVGNDTAHNIYVLDTLPNEVDANTLRIVSATHAMYVSPYGDGTHNIVKFDFPNINLLDSSHHEACTGTFTYTIMSKTGLPDGTLIDHRAGIYFDDNGLVETNTVENIVGFPASVSSVSNLDKVELYPNPATNELTIKTSKDLYSSCTVTNSMGQVMMQQQINSTETKLNVKALPAGMYFVNMVGDKGNEVRKFVKR